MDFWISEWISGFRWISGFQIIWISADSVRDFFRGGPLGLYLDIQLRAAVFEAARRMPERVEAFTR